MTPPHSLVSFNTSFPVTKWFQTTQFLSQY